MNKTNTTNTNSFIEGEIPESVETESHNTDELIPFNQSYDLQLSIGTKLTNKQEHFAMLIAQGEDDYKAYKIAYNRISDKDATLRSNAYKVKQIDGVSKAIQFYKELFIKEAVRQYEYNNEMAFKEIDEIKYKASQKGNLKVELACVQEKVKIAGLVTRKVENVVSDKSMDLINLQLKELMEKIPQNELKNLLGKDVIDVTPIDISPAD
jgi:hypothetical protein